MIALHWNVLHGHLPASWARLPSLQSAWVRPGNYQLCGKLPQQAGFALCQITSNSTSCTPVDDLGNTCSLQYPMQVCDSPATANLPCTVSRLTNTKTSPDLWFPLYRAECCPVNVQGMLGPANVSAPTLEAVLRLTGTNILPLNPSEIATLAGAVASCLDQVPEQDVYIVQVRG